MSADPYASYQLYNALKLHFETPSYDAIKYNFKTSVNPKSFLKRKDKYFFAKLAKKHTDDLMMYYVSNFKLGLSYVGDMMDEDGERNYRDHKRITESLHRVFSIDINTLAEVTEKDDITFDDLFVAIDNRHPIVIKLWMQEEISLETVVILNSVLGFIDRESKNISETITWPGIKRRIEKYTPFVRFDKDKCLILLKKRFTKD